MLRKCASRWDTVIRAERTGATESVQQTVTGIYGRFKDNINKLINIVVAGSLRKFIHILFTSDKYIISSLKSKVELISSIVVMIILAFSLFFFAIFTVFQVHAETVHLAKLATNVVSSNPEWLRTALNYTDKQIADDKIDDYIEEVRFIGCRLRGTFYTMKDEMAENTC